MITKQSEITILIDGKLDSTYWFKNQTDADLFIGVVDLIFETAFKAGQCLTEDEIEDTIASLGESAPLEHT